MPGDLDKLFMAAGRMWRAGIEDSPYGGSTRVGLVEFMLLTDAIGAKAKFAGYQYGDHELHLSYVKRREQSISKQPVPGVRLGTSLTALPTINTARSAIPVVAKNTFFFDLPQALQEVSLTKLTSAQTSAPIATQKIFLFDLPQELQDLIFDLAYPYEAGVKWITLEEHRDLHPLHSLRQLPQSKVVEFMVSKTFFVAASRAWVSSQRFDGENDTAFNILLSGLSGGIASAYVVELRSRWFDFSRSELSYRLPRLRVLELTITEK
ncbi:hypothetical protein LTR85_004081 [Meristemomyces frigidus]|nr:hypothetical protein LTR85_004081 [Meristemomyces frigidus]